MKKQIKKLLELIKGYEVESVIVIMFLILVNMIITSVFNGIAHVLTSVIKSF